MPGDPVDYAIARRDYLTAMTAQGLTDRQIGEALNVDRKTVRRWREAAGIAPGIEQSPPAPDPLEVAERRRASKRRYVDRLNRETAAVAANAYDRWTPTDDAVVLERDVVTAAYALGRTYAAVRARRQVLYARSRRARS